MVYIMVSEYTNILLWDYTFWNNPKVYWENVKYNILLQKTVNASVKYRLLLTFPSNSILHFIIFAHYFNVYS